MKLIIAGGGTGGHLFPGIAVAEEFLSRDPANEFLFVGTEKGIEARVLPREGYRLETIAAAGILGKGTLGKAKGAALLLYGYSQSRQILKSFRPDVVLGVGGYASAPLVLAARGMLIPRFIHEQNAYPGLTNKLLARVAEKVFISLDEARRFFPERKTLLTGNPLRRQIIDEIAQEPERRGEKLRLLIFGGSLGAHSVNMAVVAALPRLKLLGERLQITHQTGEKDLEEVREAYRREAVAAEVVPFINGMAAAYRSADLIVCRAGATTIAEITACGKAAIFIPFPHATGDHQRRNAEALLQQEACFLLDERELTGESLAELVLKLADDPEALEAVARKARELARPEAARVIVDEMLKQVEVKV
jgi:UDP-N-acetylglucosamine--N-acetylmuramyl-(pentapeptide) pyrophosphoryl-undecaprenol N-acetylglucosamine transferase